MGKFSQKVRWFFVDFLCTFTVIGFILYSLLGIVILSGLLTLPRIGVLLFLALTSYQKYRKGGGERWQKLKQAYAEERWKLLLPDMDGVTILFLAVNGILFAFSYLLIARDLEMWRFVKEKPEIFRAIFKELFTV